MNLCNEKELRALLSRHGFHFSKSMGQNFLIDPDVPENIAAMSGIDNTCGVLEIGPGIGTLTRELAQRAGKVVSVELDRSLTPLLNETLSDLDNVEIIYGDILKTDIHALVKDNFDSLTPCVCANLPYNITSPIISMLINSKLFSSMTLMVQREVARRICADAGKKDYGAFSVFAAYYTEREILFDVPPQSFTPSPKVHSSVIHLTMKSEAPQTLVDEEFFFRVVHAAFAQRRKTLINSLSSVFGDKISKSDLTEIIVSCNFDVLTRGEMLNLLDFARLSRKIHDFLL